MSERTRRSPKRAKPQKAALQPDDFRAYLIEKASEIAPRDVSSVLERASEVRAKATRLGIPQRLRRQLGLALELLRDHVTDECPQIPLYAVALLAVAVLYFLSPLDAIPDELPRVGTLDDALVFELAFDLGRAGIQRYCDFKDISTAGLFRIE